MNLTPDKTIIPARVPDYAYPWTPDCGDGTYRNPILYADYSDPDVIRHGDNYWMTASSFNCTPGLPILHSRDLVNWALTNHALKNVPGERYNKVQPGCGVWAPSLRFHSGRFWIFFSTPDEGIYVTTTTDPQGVWSEPHLVRAGQGLIDPCPLWDDDGQAYLVHAYAHSRSGRKHKLRIAPMSPDGTRLLGDGKIIFHEPIRQQTIEGPKFLKRDGWYYILAPAGGVVTGWQTVLRSRDIFGPYEDKIVLQQGGTAVNGPHQGALVDTPGGEWWFVHFQDTGVYGRVVHLQPVEWRDGWPLPGALNGGATAGEPVLIHRKPNLRGESITIPATSDEFSSSQLGRQWQWHANHCDDWHSLSARDGWLRLFGQPAPGDFSLTPNLLLQKFPARTFHVETILSFHPHQEGDEAGLVAAGRNHAAIALRRTARSCQIVLRMDGERILDLGSDFQVKFSLTVSDGGICSFKFTNAGGEWISIPTKFTAQAGVWIGAKVGLYATGSGYADFRYFRFTPTDLIPISDLSKL